MVHLAFPEVVPVGGLEPLIGLFRTEHSQLLLLKKGESLTFRYRVIFHKGDEKQGKVAEAFAKYAKE